MSLLNKRNRSVSLSTITFPLQQLLIESRKFSETERKFWTVVMSNKNLGKYPIASELVEVIIRQMKSFTW